MWKTVLPINDEFLGRLAIDASEPARSINADDSLLFANNTKFNGTTWETSGLPPIQLHAAIQRDTTVGGIAYAPPKMVIDNAVTINPGTTIIPITSGIEDFVVGDQIVFVFNTDEGAYTEKLLTIQAIDTTAGNITLADGIPIYIGTTGTHSFVKPRNLEYYVRAVYNNNGKIAVGPSTGSGDLRVRLTSSMGIYIQMQKFSTTHLNIDSSKVYYEIFRKVETGSFYKVGQVAPSDFGEYVHFLDSTPLDFVSSEDLDQIPEPLIGGIGETRSGPLVSKTITTSNNQIVKANLTGRPTIQIDFLDKSITALGIDGKTFTVGSKTYELAYMTKYQVTDASAPGANVLRIEANGIDDDGLVAIGDYVYLHFSGADSVRASTLLLGWYQVLGLGESGGIDYVDLDYGTTPPTLSASDYTNLSITIADTSGNIPVPSEPENDNMGGSVSSASDVYNAVPFMLASAINHFWAETGIYARGGRDLSSGRLTIYEADSVTLPAGISGLTAQGEKITVQTVVNSITPSYPNRVIASVKNYVDIFSDVDVFEGYSLPLVQDVNPDDGEEINMTISIFAESAFGSAQRSGGLVVMKAKSMYVMDLESKYNSSSSNVLQRIETSGFGCETPLAVVNVPEGIFYANQSGIYILDRQYNPQYVGKSLERWWQRDIVDRNYLSRCAGSNYTIGRKYRMSVPTKNSEGYTDTVFSFGFPESAEEIPSWTRYGDAFNASMWANMGSNTFFSSALGFVGVLRNEGELTDYSDRGQEIEMDITLRAMSFGMASSQKVVRHITAYLTSQCEYVEGEIIFYNAIDLSRNFKKMTEVKLKKTEYDQVTNFGDEILDQTNFVTFSPVDTKGTWFQTRMVIKGLYKDMTVSRVLYRVGGLSVQSKPQAQQTLSEGD